VAELINGKPDEVTFCKNTSEGLSFVANGLSWNNGDNVVTSNAEFAANVYPWMALRSRGVQVRMVFEEEGIPLERSGAIDGRTRVVAISSVQYASGSHRPCDAGVQSKGVFFCVDAISRWCVPHRRQGHEHRFLAADGRNGSASGGWPFFVGRRWGICGPRASAGCP
jgi:selenocysteine lyase/cysteine desulfurase